MSGRATGGRNAYSRAGDMKKGGMRFISVFLQHQNESEIKLSDALRPGPAIHAKAAHESAHRVVPRAAETTGEAKQWSLCQLSYTRIQMRMHRVLRTPE